MAPAESIIDPEWAETLVDLQMSFSNYWWKDHKGNKLHPGSIIMFLENINRWILLLKDFNNPTHYPMSWKGVCEYADVEAGTYLSYHLPEEPVNLPLNQAS